MTTVAQLILDKGRAVHAVSEHTPVLEAVAKMVAEDIGSLMVLRDDVPCGIFTERDYLRRVALRAPTTSPILVRQVMSPDLIFVRPDTDIDVCMALMTRMRMRHLPVLENKTLVGLISSGDIVKHLTREDKNTIEELTHYIQGR